METWYEYAILWDNPEDMVFSQTHMGVDKEHAQRMLSMCWYASGKVIQRKMTKGEWEDAAE